jgi:hypothetical protein
MERGDGVMNTLGQSDRVGWIMRAGNDAQVRLPLQMKPPKIRMIMGEHGTLVGGCVPENRRVVNALVRPTGLLNR